MPPKKNRRRKYPTPLRVRGYQERKLRLSSGLRTGGRHRSRAWRRKVGADARRRMRKMRVIHRKNMMQGKLYARPPPPRRN